MDASEHIRKFERDWMHELHADFPDIPDIDLYHDGLRAYLAQEVESKAMRHEIARQAGVLVDKDGF